MPCILSVHTSQKGPKFRVLHAKRYTGSKKVHHRRLCGWDKYQRRPCDENFVCKVSPLMNIALLTESSREMLHYTGKHPLLCTRKWRGKLMRDKTACTGLLMIIFSDQMLFLYFDLIWPLKCIKIIWKTRRCASCKKGESVTHLQLEIKRC